MAKTVAPRAVIVDPTGGSGRGKMRVCENVASWPDNCSTAYFVRGSHYK